MKPNANICTPTIKINYLRFRPTISEASDLKMRAEDLLERSPSDASIQVDFEKTFGSIITRARIISKAGSFAADAVANQPLQAFDDVIKNLSSQLVHWKESRFQPSPEGST